jgi:hypothetical protein
MDCRLSSSRCARTVHQPPLGRGYLRRRLRRRRHRRRRRLRAAQTQPPLFRHLLLRRRCLRAACRLPPLSVLSSSAADTSAEQLLARDSLRPHRNPVIGVSSAAEVAALTVAVGVAVLVAVSST